MTFIRYCCPMCAAFKTFTVDATMKVIAKVNGEADLIDYDDHPCDPEWDGDDTMKCGACGHADNASEFEYESTITSPGKYEGEHRALPALHLSAMADGEECGSMATTGWVAFLMRRVDDLDFAAEYRKGASQMGYEVRDVDVEDFAGMLLSHDVIIVEHDDGFVTLETFGSREKCDARWRDLQAKELQAYEEIDP